MDQCRDPDRRTFLRRALAVGGFAVAGSAGPAESTPAPSPQTAGFTGLDHVAVPMRSVEAMIAFYRGLGFAVREGGAVVSVHSGDQKINFHRPSVWEDPEFTLRAPAATPPCGDFCWVWGGTGDQLRRTLDGVDAEIVAEGERRGGADGGDAVGQSVYVRDPDGNLLEFIRYG